MEFRSEVMRWSRVWWNEMRWSDVGWLIEGRVRWSGVV